MIMVNLNVSTLILCLLTQIVPFVALAQDVDMWNGKQRLNQNNRAQAYSAALHNQFSDIKANYEENGIYYYGDTTNSFGFRDVLNPKHEMVFCGAGDKSFSDTVKVAAASGRGAAHGVSGVKHSATTSGFSPATMQEAMHSSLRANTTSKGRFCYRTNDSTVDYRQDTARTAVYCPVSAELPYTDQVSGFGCGLKLDIPLKVGETRFLRQLQGSKLTIAQGFIGCYANPTTGVPQTTLIDNPASCTPTSRTSCIRTCDWAHDVVCEPKLMPRWGGGLCGGYGTVLFKGDVVSIEASPQLSYSDSTKTLYQGAALMACSIVSGKAQWILTSSSCTAVPPKT
jgi:hypothetical protein